VSGSGPNVFGHTLLRFNVDAGYYAHIHRDGKHKPDVICGHEAFKEYLRSENKKVLHEIAINDITDRNAGVANSKAAWPANSFGVQLHTIAPNGLQRSSRLAVPNTRRNAGYPTR
jgi:hypothetical protein